MTASDLERPKGWLRRVQLRSLLIAPFVLQLVAAIGLTNALSLRNGARAVNEVTSKLRQEITARVTERVQAYLEVPHHINQANAHAIQLGQLDLDRVITMERHFWLQSQIFADASFIYYGNEAGETVGVERLEDGTLQVGYGDRATNGGYYTYSVDDSGNRIEQIKAEPDYDPRQRPWYRVAVEAGEATWSDIYTFYSRQTLGISADLPIYDAGGTLRGVMAADITLTRLNDFLQSLNVSPNGETFIVDRDGFVVASSSAELPYVEKGDDLERLLAKASEVETIAGAIAFLSDRFGQLDRITASVQLDFDLDDERHFLQATPILDGRGIDWLAIVVVPEADFMGPIYASTHVTILLCMAALGMATGIGIVTARWVSRPLVRLSQAAEDIAQLSPQTPSAPPFTPVPISGTTEVQTLGRAFNRMARQLRVSFSDQARATEKLTSAKTELERRVAERTSDLQAQVERERELQHQLERANAELQRLATVDGLTQLANRRHFDTYLAQSWKTIARASDEIALVLCDVDFFKHYNDTYGHLAGDACLQKIAAIARSAVDRSTDLVARYGGEEIALLLPKTSLAGALKVAERFCERLAAARLEHASSKVSRYVTLSCGVASISPEKHAESPQLLIQQADAALYRAKAAGRDRAVCFTETHALPNASSQPPLTGGINTNSSPD
ncbi:MAG: diguanylate cyclase [Cyanobacteria bacterium P01_F01_bin.33]